MPAPVGTGAEAQGSLLSDLLQGSAVGLAIFNSSLALVRCNDKYAELFGYCPEDVLPGTQLENLIRVKLGRRKLSEEVITENVVRAKQSLRSPSPIVFPFVTTQGISLIITRNLLANGTLVETAQLNDNSASESFEFEQSEKRIADMARERMTHALEAMDFVRGVR